MEVIFIELYNKLFLCYLLIINCKLNQCLQVVASNTMETLLCTRLFDTIT